MPDIGTRKLVLRVDSTDFTDSVSNVRIVAGEKDSDFMSFAEAAAGGAREYKLAMALKQATDTTSLWTYAWSEAGTDVPVEVWPNGYNAGVASTTYPKVSGTVTVVEPDGDFLGGEANKSTTARFVTEVEWTFTAKPTLDDGSSGS
jgi:hypothetical protein